MKLFSEEESGRLRRTFEAEVLGWPGVRAKKMFGCPSYLVGDELFAVLVTRGVVLTRLGEEDRRELASRAPSGPFRARGRTVAKWEQTEVRDDADLSRIMPFVRKSYEAVGRARTPRRP